MTNIKELEKEIAELERALAAKKSQLQALKDDVNKSRCVKNNRLTNKEISRYSRQIILDEVGVKGQVALRSASVLIVGAGGLGKSNE